MTLEFDNLEETIQYLEGKALDHALKVYSIVLDGSPKSIQDVEEILARLHGHYLVTKTLEGIFGIAMFYGAYVGEVIRKANITEAKWRGEASGRAFPSLTWHAQPGGDSTVFPMNWCYERILKGPAENIWFKYQASIARDFAVVKLIEQHKKGTD